MLTVNPAALTITADNASKTYGQTVTFTGSEFTSTGLQNGDIDRLGDAHQCRGAGHRQSPATLHDHPSAATGGTFNCRNYTITYVNGIADGQSGGADHHGRQHEQDLRPDVTFAGTRVHQQRPQNGET